MKHLPQTILTIPNREPLYSRIVKKWVVDEEGRKIEDVEGFNFVEEKILVKSDVMAKTKFKLKSDSLNYFDSNDFGKVTDNKVVFNLKPKMAQVFINDKTLAKHWGQKVRIVVGVSPSDSLEEILFWGEHTGGFIGEFYIDDADEKNKIGSYPLIINYEDRLDRVSVSGTVFSDVIMPYSIKDDSVTINFVDYPTNLVSKCFARYAYYAFIPKDSKVHAVEPVTIILDKCVRYAEIRFIPNDVPSSDMKDTRLFKCSNDSGSSRYHFESKIAGEGEVWAESFYVYKIKGKYRMFQKSQVNLKYPILDELWEDGLIIDQVKDLAGLKGMTFDHKYFDGNYNVTGEPVEYVAKDYIKILTETIYKDNDKKTQSRKASEFWNAFETFFK